jgi:hypothetical protein
VRVISQEFDPDRPDVREIQVAVPEEAPPSVGDRIELDSQVFVIEGVYRWYLSPGIDLDYREIAFDLAVRREGSAGAGVTEPLPEPPPALSAGAEAVPPEDSSSEPDEPR